jgi:hypothetical protein
MNEGKLIKLIAVYRILTLLRPQIITLITASALNLGTDQQIEVSPATLLGPLSWFSVSNSNCFSKLLF